MPDDERSWRDEDRPSWRELDKLRDRSRHRKDEKPAFEGTKKQRAYARTLALKTAGKLFTPKKTPEQRQAEEALAAAKGTAAFDELAKAFAAKFGVTADWHTQLLLCEAGASEVAGEAIVALQESAAKLELAEKRVVVSKLKMLAMTGKTKIKAAAKQALEMLD
jgi:hypothetical protein